MLTRYNKLVVCIGLLFLYSSSVLGAESYTLTVQNGYGSGQYKVGTKVHIFADVDPYRSVVTSWSSASEKYLSEEWHFVFTMPAEDTVLSPKIIDVAMKLRSEKIQAVNLSKRMIIATPPNPKGLLFLFHGTSGSADVIYKPSMQYLARLAYHRGLTVVSLDAEERTLNLAGLDGKIRWNASPDIESNIDLQNIQHISNLLSEQGRIPHNAPRYAIGMSNGGAFSITLGASLKFASVTSFCAPARVSAWRITTTPSQWLMCAEDNNPTVAARRDQWQDGYNNLTARKVRSDYAEHQASPLFAGRFARILGVSKLQSATVVAELEANGVLDSMGFLTASPADISADYIANPGRWPNLGYIMSLSSAGRVVGELKVAWGDHQMFDDWAARALNFQAPAARGIPILDGLALTLLLLLFAISAIPRLKS